jgi:hypothetical protein
MRRKDYGTAPTEEILSGMKMAHEIATKIQAVKSPAVQNMILELLTLVKPRSGPQGKDGKPE